MSYTIKILSRDLTTPSTINETDITNNVIQGFSFVEKLDESMDIGSMIVRGVTQSTPYDLYDTIEVYEDSTVKFSMRIIGDSVKIISKSPLRYEHTLSLVEHTQILERFLISGKTFTQPTDGTVRYYLYDVIDQLNDVIPLQPTSSVSSTRIFEMPTGDLATYLQSIESPEFTFKDLTMKEALFQICGYVDGIPRLNRESDGTLRLTIDFVNEPNNAIPTSANFLTQETQQDNEFYATTIVSEAQNLVAENDINEGKEVYPAIGMWIVPRSNEYVFDYSSSFIFTPKRIYNISKLEQLAFATVSTTFLARDIYSYKTRMYFYDTSTDFPTDPYTEIGLYGFGDELYFVDVSDSNKTYEWDGSNYVVSSTVDTSIHPRINYYETLLDFQSGISYYTNSGYYFYDVNVDLSTGKTYRYDITLTDWVELTHFDKNGILIFDLSDRVFERNYWNTLDEEGSPFGNSNSDPSLFYKFNTLKYDYREQNIELGTTGGLFNTGTDIDNIREIKGYEMLLDDGIIPSNYQDYSDFNTSVEPSLSGDNYYNYLLFRVTYTPIPTEQRVEIERQDLTDVFYQSQLQANQQARSINLEAFSNNLEGKINRIGNSELSLSNKVLNLSSSNYYSINDYTDDDFIVTERETIVFTDFCLVKYGLTRNYNMISKFIGVNSEIRQYEMGEQDTLTRIIRTKDFVEIDVVNSGNGSDSSNYFTLNGRSCYLDTFKTNSEFEPVRGGYFFSADFPLTTIVVLAPFSSNGGGNTLMFFQKQISNYYNDTRSLYSASRITREFINYTTVESGIISEYSFALFDKIDSDVKFIVDLIDSGNNVPNISPTLAISSQDINKLYINSPNVLVNKDTREELGHLHSIPNISKRVNDVIIGRTFTTRNRMVTDNPPTSFKLYTYDTEKLNKNDNFTVKDGYDSVATLLASNINIDYVNNKVTITHSNLTSSKSAWILTDENDKVIIGANQDGTLLNTITFDFVKERTGVKYKY